MLKTRQNKDQTQKPASVCHFKSMHELHAKATHEMHADSHTAIASVQLRGCQSELFCINQTNCHCEYH